MPMPATFDQDGRVSSPDAAPALDLALDLATIAFEHGASAIAADRAFAAVTHALGVDDAFAVWRLDCVTAGRREHPGTVVRPLVPRGVNLRSVGKVAELVEHLSQQPMDVGRVRQQVEGIGSLGSYGPWTLIAVTGFAAAVFSKNLNGQWLGVGSALVGASVGQALRQELLRRDLSGSGTTLACATVSALIAAIGLHLRMGTAGPTALVASVVYLIPGVALINGFFEAVIPRYAAVGVQRIASALVVCVLMAIAVAFAVAVMRQF